MKRNVPPHLVMDKLGKATMQKCLREKNVSTSTQPESLMQRLVSEYEKNGPSEAIPDTNYILSDTLDHFWAGVGTSGDALGPVFYQLSHPQNKECQKRLRQALKDAGISSTSEITIAQVKNVEFLDAVIKESFRVSPPVPFSMSRKVPEGEGMELLGHWIPPGVTIPFFLQIP
jgi:cytochrome P450